MADSSNIPLTIVTFTTALYNNGKYNPDGIPQIKIGGNLYNIPNVQPLNNCYWALVIDRTSSNLSVVQNFTFNDNNDVPAVLNQYSNNSNYLLILTTRYLATTLIPAGAWYTYLTTQMNAGPALARIEQIFGAMYSSTYQYMGYTLVAPFDGSVEQAIEYSETDATVSTYTLQLIPEQNPDGSGGVLYVPYELF